MLMTKTSPLNDQAKLKILCDDLCDNIEELLAYFNLDYKDHGKMIAMACPIHDGDNIGALNLYTQGDTYRGNWKCRTHQCEKIFKGSIIGFVRGLLSRQKYAWNKSGDSTCSFKETIDFIAGFLKKDLKDIKVSKLTRDKNKFANTISHIQPGSHKTNNAGLNRKSIRSLLEIPAQYYIDRGFSTAILDKYDVGLCKNPNKEMYNRIVVPIYDNEYKYMIGCSGRSIFEKCAQCSCFHNPAHECPKESHQYLHSKWKHSTNFKSQFSLYNLWFAQKHIQETGVAIIVESPGNVWKLEENNIHNSVGIFGAHMSDRQKILLDASGAMNLILLMDNDDAGKKATQNIIEKCQKTYRVHVPKIYKSDVAEMNADEIDTEIKQFIKRVI